MTMHSLFISLIFLSVVITINGQYDDERDLPREQYTPERRSQASFDGQFTRGQCPERFYQVGNECLFFGTDGLNYKWNQIERVCSKRIARMINQQPYNILQQNPTAGKSVRQLVLNTPEKTQVFRALAREHSEQNFGVRLPSDYNQLQRCPAPNDDNWPQYCSTSQNSNATCLETTSESADIVCLREVDCGRGRIRVACEFTLPGGEEITTSKFRTCPVGRRLRYRLPLWAWILIAVGSSLLLLGIVVGILGFLRKTKKSKGPTVKSLPDPDDKPVRIPPTLTDPATEPMLIRPPPPDTSYLQPRTTGADSGTNA